MRRLGGAERADGSALFQRGDGLTQDRLQKLGMAAALAVTFGSGALLVPALPSVAQGSGVYTTAQAQRGSKLFTDDCAMCHGSDLSGGAGPPLAGKAFIGKWTGQTADDLHDVVSTQMPLTAPGSLKPDEYLALVAFILSKNGYPAGGSDLAKAKLKNITIKAQ
jgi:mono/diheme cytochrome c family protein